MTTKRGYKRVSPKTIKEEDVFVEVAPPVYNNTVKVQSLYPAHLTYEGSVSGQPYEWLKAGDVLSVLEEDVPALLSYRIGKGSCCGAGNPNGNQVFQLFIE